jgi:hypothetical protein
MLKGALLGTFLWVGGPSAKQFNKMLTNLSFNLRISRLETSSIDEPKGVPDHGSCSATPTRRF